MPDVEFIEFGARDVLTISDPAAGHYGRGLYRWCACAARRMQPIPLGLAIPLAVLATFAVGVAPASDRLEGVSTGRMAKLTSYDRHALVASLMGRGVSNGAGGNTCLRCWFTLTLLTVGCIRSGAAHPAVVVIGFTVLGVLVADYTMYVLTPYDVTWHVSTSWPRLITQLWPMLVWAAAMSVAGFVPRPARPQNDQGSVVRKPLLANPSPMSGARVG